jgi:hypothetical protein
MQYRAVLPGLPHTADTFYTAVVAAFATHSAGWQAAQPGFTPLDIMRYLPCSAYVL